MIFFLVAAFGITWAAAYPFRNVSREMVELLPLALAMFVLAQFGPSIAGLLSTARAYGDRGAAALLRSLLPRPAVLPWLVAAAALPAAIGLAATWLTAWRGTPMGPVEPRALEAFPLILLAKLVRDGGLAEELGWRGFALPWLQRRVHPVAASLVIGLLWAAWHVPLFHLLDSTTFGRPWLPFTVVLVAASVVFTWFYNRTGGSLLVCVVLHASLKATEAVLIRAVPLHWLGGTVDFVHMALWITVALGLILATGGRLGGGRLSRTSPSDSAAPATTGP